MATLDSMDVSIVIVSWNVKKLLKECLHSIYHQDTNLSYEAFVVDNNSHDESAEMVSREFPQVHLIQNKKNRGFSFACNQAIEKSTGATVLLLNPDVQINSSALEDSYRYMKENSDVGICGSHIIHPDGTTQHSVRSFPDLVSHILILLKLHNFFPNLPALKKYFRNDFDYTKTQAVDQVMGAFFLIRRELINAIGMLDTHFYIWYEEVDYCKRARDAGFVTHYFAQANVVHYKGESFKQVSAIRKQLILNRSILYYFYKNRPLLEYILILALYPISLFLAVVVQLFSIKKKSKDL